MRLFNASVLPRKSLNRNLSWGFPFGNLITKARVLESCALERKREPNANARVLGTLRFRTPSSPSPWTFGPRKKNLHPPPLSWDFQFKELDPPPPLPAPRTPLPRAEKTGKGRNTVSRVLFRRRELTEPH